MSRRRRHRGHQRWEKRTSLSNDAGDMEITESIDFYPNRHGLVPIPLDRVEELLVDAGYERTEEDE